MLENCYFEIKVFLFFTMTEVRTHIKFPQLVCELVFNSPENCICSWFIAFKSCKTVIVWLKPVWMICSDLYIKPYMFTFPLIMLCQKIYLVVYTKWTLICHLVCEPTIPPQFYYLNHIKYVAQLLICDPSIKFY